MKKVLTLEEAIRKGYNHRKVEELAKEELGSSSVTRRKLVQRVEQARRNLEK